MQVIKQNQVQEKIIVLRNQKIIIDSDVAELYGVETKRINEAVKNNPEKFPVGYLVELNSQEKNELVENFDRFEKLKHSSASLKGFTEKGLYMLATILKSPKAVETTLAIIDTFTKVRELSQTVE
jgi:phage regulator Rha-like protein